MRRLIRRPEKNILVENVLCAIRQAGTTSLPRIDKGVVVVVFYFDCSVCRVTTSHPLIRNELWGMGSPDSGRTSSPPRCLQSSFASGPITLERIRRDKREEPVDFSVISQPADRPCTIREELCNTPDAVAWSHNIDNVNLSSIHTISARKLSIRSKLRVGDWKEIRT